ncbi:MAG: hypothetical protein ABFD92_12760 [Planctomycetaceae bacterium]|nr:hypothetical protein [Planctomycetaceae bacterium]
MQLVVKTIRLQDGEYQAICPCLPYCVSRGRTHDEVISKHRETVRGYMAALTNFVPDRLEFSVVDEP